MANWPLKAKAEPLVLLDMMPLERLGVAAVVGPAGGVADVADGGHADVLLHQRFILAAVVEAKNLGDRADFLMGIDQLLAMRIEGGHARGKLPAVLHVQQHPRHQPRDFVGALLGAQRAEPPPGQMVDRGNTAFVVQVVAHRIETADRSGPKETDRPWRQQSLEEAVKTAAHG